MQVIAGANNLRLEGALNRESLITLEEVFVQRAYADYFPFYKKATLVDVGAHKGYFSLFAYKNAGPGSTLIAVEPNASNLEVLRQNLVHNQADQVEVVAAALHSKDEAIQLYCGASANHTIVPAEGVVPNEDTMEVQGIQLSTLMQRYQLEEVDFLKLDCEGAEYEILFGLSQAVFQKIKVISMEFHDLKRPGHTALDLADHLEKMGFEIMKLEHRPTHRNLNHGRLIARQRQ